MEPKKQIPIWFFIGILLAVYGVLIFASGIYYGWISPPIHKVVFADKHVDVWWGLLLVLIGGFYVLRFRPGKTVGQ
ncbi:MAG: hypothetical protein ABSG50_04995 [Opitutaceae bacterium]|jgi:hypothetical protein